MAKESLGRLFPPMEDVCHFFEADDGTVPVLTRCPQASTPVSTEELIPVRRCRRSWYLGSGKSIFNPPKRIDMEPQK